VLLYSQFLPFRLTPFGINFGVKAKTAKPTGTLIRNTHDQSTHAAEGAMSAAPIPWSALQLLKQ
jgi:hypothetical protein